MGRDMRELGDPQPPSTLSAESLPPMRDPVFPTEIWALICPHLDSRTLWNRVRLTSRRLLLEAEREMNLNRLPKLCFRWRLGFDCVMKDCMCEAMFTVKQLSHFSENNQRVHFNVDHGIADSSFNSCAHPGHSFAGEKLAIPINRYYQQDVLRHLNYREREPIDFPTIESDRSIVLGGLVGQVELPGMKVDFRKGQFSWE
ncbi:hypothetical protein NX059_011993 [Plenodomus lindquistii]|nr:hypothetical protein NX059_011993 [Plenodomus lindquistii]